MRYYIIIISLIFILTSSSIFILYQVYDSYGRTIQEKERLHGLKKDKDSFKHTLDLMNEGIEVAIVIENGLLTWQYPSSGALLKGGDHFNANSHCSGTLIGCRTFLTAAHCIFEFNSDKEKYEKTTNYSQYKVFFQHAGFFDITDMNYIEGEYVYEEAPADIAIITLSEPVTGIPISQINEIRHPNVGTPGEIVGFGREGGRFDEFNEYGIKRMGKVVLSKCKEESNTTSVCWDFEKPVGPQGQDSNTCQGDSGGGLFITIDNLEVIAGVTSGGPNLECKPTDHPFDTNVYHYRSWINENSIDDLKNTNCSNLPVVGSSKVILEGPPPETLSKNKQQIVKDIFVPDNTSLLRVSLNASFNPSVPKSEIGNFDLYVKRGSFPSPGDYDCSHTGPSQFGFCEFKNPEAGDWYILVRRVSGEGLLQVTSTIFKN